MVNPLTLYFTLFEDRFAKTSQQFTNAFHLRKKFLIITLEILQSARSSIRVSSSARNPRATLMYSESSRLELRPALSAMFEDTDMAARLR
jgi:hypothetical protein